LRTNIVCRAGERNFVYSVFAKVESQYRSRIDLLYSGKLYFFPVEETGIPSLMGEIYNQPLNPYPLTPPLGGRAGGYGYIYLIMYNVLKRVFTFSVVATTMLWSVGVAALIPSVAQGATCPTLAAGDMIKVTGKAAIYAIRSDLKVLYFPSGDEFKSWRPTYGGYISITQECFDSLSVPSNYPGAVNYHPGSYLIKRPSSDQLYVVEPNNTRATISTTTAAALYGTSAYIDGVGAKVMTVSDVFWPHYINVGTPVTEVKAHPGMLIKVSGITYYIDADSKYREVTPTGFTANGFQERFVRALTTDAIAGLMAGTAITAEVPAIVDKTQSGGVIAPPISTGNVSVALAASTPGAQDIPDNASVEFLKLTLTNTGSTDASLTGIKLSAYGLGTASDIDQVSVYYNNQRYGNAKDVDSNKQAQINFTTALALAKGASITLVVKAQVTGTGHYALGVAAAADVMGVTASGNFPIVGNTMSGVAVAVGELTIDNNGSLAAVNLGDKAVTVAKFKVTNDNVEDIALKSINLKRDSASTANDSALENLSLWVDGSQVASASAIVGKYVSFTLTSPFTILKSGTKSFTVKGDAVDGAGKAITLMLDADSDISATGAHYGFSSIIVNNMTGASLTINAGTVTVEKLNAANTKLVMNTNDVEMGTFKITANSGKTVELSRIRLSINSLNDDNIGANSAFAEIENLKIFDKYNNTTYDLAYVNGSDTGALKVYQNTDTITLATGITHELVVRCDVLAAPTANNGDYIVKIADAAGGDLVLKETGDDTAITDITPNSVSLNKVSIEGATVTFSKNALSSVYSAVVGSTNHDLMSFNVKAGQASQIKMTELKFKNQWGGATIDKAVVSEFKLYKGANLVKTVSANLMSAEEIAFTDLAEYIEPNATNAYSLKVSLVNDSLNDGKQMEFYLSAYSVEETNKGTAVYDVIADNISSNGIISAGELGYTSLLSPRVLTIVGYGSLNVLVDNTVTLTKYNTYQLGGTNDVPVATFKMRASNEEVKVTSLKIRNNSDISYSVSKFALYEEGVTTPVAYATNIGTSETVLDQDFIVPANEKTYTLKADFTKIGQNEPGYLDTEFRFGIEAIEAEGVSSGATLVPGDLDGTVEAGEITYEGDAVGVLYTNPSMWTGIVASKMQPVSLVSSYGGQTLSTGLTSGIAANAAIIAVTAPATSNNNADGTALKLDLNYVIVKVENNLAGFSATIERIGGSQGAIADNASWAGYADFNTGGYDTDFQITPGETAYFLVKVVPTFGGTGTWGIKVGLDDLNYIGNGNFYWLDRSDASTKYEVRMPGISSITGTEIKTTQ
jgi:hypothetical protein